MIKVIDNGCGIEEAILPKLFSRTAYLEESVDKGFKGLGLIICK